MRLQTCIRNPFHDCEPLVSTTFVNGENEDDMRVCLECIVQLFSWAECGRPDIVVLGYLHALRILTLHYEELCFGKVDWCGIDDIFPLFCFGLVVVRLVLVLLMLLILTIACWSTVNVIFWVVCTTRIRSLVIRSYTIILRKLLI